MLMLLTVLSYSPEFLFGQVNIIVNNADSVLRQTGNCDSAMQILQKLPAANKESGTYYELMGRIYECKSNKEYANIYYEKAFNKGVTHNGWKQEQTATGSSKQNNSLKRETQRNIDDIYSVVALGYNTATGGKKAVSEHGICFSFSIGFPIISNKFLVDFTPTVGAIYGNPTAWYEPIKNTGRPPSDMPGLLMGIESSLNYILLNSRTQTVTCGWTAGIQGVGIGVKVVEPGSGNSAATAWLSTGPRLAYYGWKHLYVAAEYMHLGSKRIYATLEGSTQSAPVNLDQFRVDIGFRFDLYN